MSEFSNIKQVSLLIKAHAKIGTGLVVWGFAVYSAGRKLWENISEPCTSYYTWLGFPHDFTPYKAHIQGLAFAMYRGLQTIKKKFRNVTDVAVVANETFHKTWIRQMNLHGQSEYEHVKFVRDLYLFHITGHHIHKGRQPLMDGLSERIASRLVLV
jgi:hypothetical protein